MSAAKCDRLTLRKSDGLDDWYVIERAEHDGRRWMEKTDYGFALHTSARFSDNADVEGDGAEMLAVAAAIEARGEYDAKRCAVRVDGDRVEFWSPRNSESPGVVTLAVADALAAEIRNTLSAGGAS